MAALDLKDPPAHKPARAAQKPPSTGSSPLLTVARLSGAAALLISAVIHAVRASEGGVGTAMLFGAAGLIAAVLAFGVVRLSRRLPVLLGFLFMAIAFMAITSAFQIVGSLIGTGYQETLPSPYAALSPYVHIAGLILLLIAAGLMLRGGAAKSRSRPINNVVEMASLVPGPDPRTAQPIKWPGDRAQRAGLAETKKSPRRSKAAPSEPAASKPVQLAPGEPLRWRAAPLPQAAAPKGKPAKPAKPVSQPKVVEAPAAQPIAETAPALSTVAETPEQPPAADHVIRWRSSTPVLGDATSPAQAVVTVAEAAPAAAEAAVPAQAAPAAVPAEEAPAEAPVPVAPEPGPEARAMFLDPVPMSISEPYYRLLLREVEVLRRLEAALGGDDPRTLTSRSVIAYNYVAGGEVVRGVELQEIVAADFARIRGESHPHTVDARTKLAQWRKMARKQRRSKAPVPA